MFDGWKTTYPKDNQPNKTDSLCLSGIVFAKFYEWKKNWKCRNKVFPIMLYNYVNWIEKAECRDAIITWIYMYICGCWEILFEKGNFLIFANRTLIFLDWKGLNWNLKYIFVRKVYNFSFTKSIKRNNSLKFNHRVQTRNPHNRNFSAHSILL